MISARYVSQELNSYRKDIDGLRAISIIFVILNHLRLPFMPGGFLGVDIFFVISGFLITLHIAQSIKLNSFSFKKFYMRRARRILPALFVVLLTTSIASYFLLRPSELKQFAGSLSGALFFYSNLYSWKVCAAGYFSQNASIMPLLHTWSLAIEEQFYLTWPLILYFTYKYIPRLPAVYIALIITVLSYVSYVVLAQHATFVFYSPLTRAYELLIGALLALNYDAIKLPKNSMICHLISLIGLAMILFSGFFLTKNDFPGSAMLIPCVGAFLILYIGKNNHSIANVLIGNRIFSFIGLISYSLYLWHWPIIAFVNYFSVQLNFYNAGMIIIVSFLLSFLTWRFIELPFRFNLRYTLKKQFFYWRCLLCLS